MSLANIQAMRALKIARDLAKGTTATRNATNIITNGNFSSSSIWSAQLASKTISTVTNEGIFTPTATFGQIYQLVSLIANHKYYFSADVKSTSNQVRVDVYDNSSSTQISAVLHPGDNTYHKLAGIATPTKDSSTVNFRIYDSRTSGWDSISVKNCVLVDLTAIYGSGKEPTYSDFANILNSQLGNYFFDGTAQVTLPLIGQIGQSVSNITNLINNADFSANGGWSSTLTALAIDTINKQANFTPTAQYGQTYQTVSLTNGHKYYYCAYVKATSNLVKFDLYDSSSSTQYALTAHSGDGTFNKLSGIVTPTKSTSSAYFRILDYRTSGWNTISVQNCVFIDLTAFYGIGNEPTQLSLETSLKASTGGTFFNGSAQISTPVFSQMEIDAVGILKGNGAGNVVAAIPGIDFATATSRGMVVSISGTLIRCAFKYNATQDMWVDFMPSGPSLLPQIRYVYLASNTSGRVSSNMNNSSITTLLSVATDMVGPYVVQANSNGNSETSTFTGGWHGYDNTGTSTIPTATNLSINVYADGYLVSNGDTVSCDRIDIEVVNAINAWNTKQPDGKGRNVLQETVHYSLTPHSIEVTNDIQALESITIQTYYGIQTSDFGSGTTVHYVNGAQQGRIAIPAVANSGNKSTNPNVDRWCERNGNNNLIAWCDNTYGLGNRANVASTSPLAFSESYGKTYFNLVNGVYLTLAAGSTVSWRGGFIFTESLTCNGADLAYTFMEGNKRKYVVDFLAASASSKLQTSPNDRNKSVSVDSASSGVTVGNWVGSTGLSVSSTGYGQTKITV